MARWTLRWAPPESRRSRRNRSANSAARSASGPSAETLPAGCASSRSDGEGIAAPSPPKHRPRLPLRSSTPKCNRAGASMKTLARSDILGQQVHRLPFPGPRCLVYDDLQPGQLLTDLFRWQQVSPGRQNCRFQYCVTSPVESNELTLYPAMNHAGLNPGSRWCGIHRDDLELSPGTGRIQHRSTYDCSGVGGELGAGDGALGKEHGVIGQVDHR